MRIAVTGRQGQVTTALQRHANIVALGRPELDLVDLTTILPALRAARPDVIVSAAAYTAVDKAESEPDAAFAINHRGAGAVAAAAAELGLPVIHLSTDYVFDGTKASPYVETDPTAPLNVYGASKLAGEQAVAAATADHVVLRTTWVYAAQGVNFVRTMLRLAETRDHLRVVDDQIGRPSYAADIAAAILTIAHRLKDDPSPDLRGIFHYSGGGDPTSWAGFARAIFSRAGKQVEVEPIPSSDYPTPAKRPANSCLSCDKLAKIHGVIQQDWRESLSLCLKEM